MPDRNENWDKADRIARRSGQFAKGFILGVLILMACVEIFGATGNSNTFQYQGY